MANLALDYHHTVQEEQMKPDPARKR